MALPSFDRIASDGSKTAIAMFVIKNAEAATAPGTHSS
eukprot:CAMPEP_0198129910 /NCGR_PEP_ID=MMETSP1442-20131203/52781_1 /TAXON_ID= /ORGANISM="Craspedostauros australis, Strain CCMP3328" /LENGTH=37 /DNA_ID= /DNA_START= /DNA_END= /DNA_ORIENTATION=